MGSVNPAYSHGRECSLLDCDIAIAEVDVRISGAAPLRVRV